MPQREPASGDSPGNSLQARLVTTGVRLVDSEGAAALSVRRITTETGVSHGAPRRYFPSHQLLLVAVARRGLEDLAADLAAAINSQTEARAQLHAIAVAYLEFARTRRNMFDLVIRHDLLGGSGANFRQAPRALFATVAGVVSRALADTPAGDFSEVVQTRTALLWTHLHGTAALSLAGALPVVTTGNSTWDADAVASAAKAIIGLHFPAPEIRL